MRLCSSACRVLAMPYRRAERDDQNHECIPCDRLGWLPRKERTMYFGYGLSGIILLVVVVLLLTGRL